MLNQNEKMDGKENRAPIAYLPETHFEAEVLKSKLPVLVAFETPWSRPCQVEYPILQELAREWAGLIKVVRVNADDSLDLSFGYDIQSIPTLLYFVGGQVRFRIVGTATKEAILAKLKTNGGAAAVDPSQTGTTGTPSQS